MPTEQGHAGKPMHCLGCAARLGVYADTSELVDAGSRGEGGSGVVGEHKECFVAGRWEVDWRCWGLLGVLVRTGWEALLDLDF